MEGDNFERRPSQVMAWLGFGLSLSVFVLIWVLIALIFTHIGDKDYPIVSLLMLAIPVVGIIGLMGFIFSIIGLVSANRHNGKKWPGVSGIMLCCLSLLSLFAPVIIGTHARSSHDDLISDSVIVTEANKGVVIHITDRSRLKCYDNRDGIDDKPAVLSMYSYDIEHEIETWMQMNNISSSERITILTDSDVEYSDVVGILDVLKDLGITQIEVSSDNNAR